MDCLEDLFTLSGEDSCVWVYDKNYPNCIAIAKLSQQSKTYVSGCSWLSSKPGHKEKFLYGVDNLGTMKYFSVKEDSVMH